MEERINQALIKLEEDLQSITSAREQVDKTVKSSVDLQKVVGEYVDSVKLLCSKLLIWSDNIRGKENSLGQEVESAIHNIEKTCEELIVTFGTKTENAMTSFQNVTNDILNKYIAENDRLVKYVESLDALSEQIMKTKDEIQSVKDSIMEISKELKESQDEQDEALNDIKQRIIDLPSTINERTESIIQTITKTESVLSSLISNTNNIIAEYANAVISNIDDLKGLSQKIDTTILASTNSLTTVVNTSHKDIVDCINVLKEECEKSTKLNRVIIVIGFVILILLHFLLK